MFVLTNIEVFHAETCSHIQIFSVPLFSCWHYYYSAFISDYLGFKLKQLKTYLGILLSRSFLIKNYFHGDLFFFYIYISKEGWWKEANVIINTNLCIIIIKNCKEIPAWVESILMAILTDLIIFNYHTFCVWLHNRIIAYGLPRVISCYLQYRLHPPHHLYRSHVEHDVCLAELALTQRECPSALHINLNLRHHAMHICLNYTRK